MTLAPSPSLPKTRPPCRWCHHQHSSHAFFPHHTDPALIGDAASWCVDDERVPDCDCLGYEPITPPEPVPPVDAQGS